MNAGQDRIAGFDVLRGICAIGVLFYHLFSWTGVRVYNVGLYGVYIFFVLSGASLFVTYAGRFANGFSIARFIGLRFVRLAPLYIPVVLIETVRLGYVHDAHWWLRVLMNVTFVFGFANPGATSTVTGGWSLGIEFVFYCLFPVFVALLARGRVASMLAVFAAFIVQMAFVRFVLAGTGDTLVSNWTSYTQPLAFVFYFVVGCAIGRLVLHMGPVRPSRPFLMWGLFATILIIIGTTSGPDGASSLLGIRGALLSLLSVAAVLVAAKLRVSPRFKWAADALGAMSYGVYLLHPLVAVWLEPLNGPLPFSVYVGAVAVVSVAAALIIERWFERPISDWGKGVLCRSANISARVA